MIVFNCKIDPLYFLDQMSTYEAGLLIDAFNREYKEGWERQRWTAYITAASSGAKLKKPSDLMTFSWELPEVNDVEVKVKTIEEVKEERERLIKKFITK